MIYLDSGATSLMKPPAVHRAVMEAMQHSANAGRGGYGAAMKAGNILYDTREEAAKLFDCKPEQVAFTFNCTHGLNIAIRTLVSPGAHVVVSGFEHNAVMRPLIDLRAKIRVAGRRLFDWDNTLTEFEKALDSRPDCAVFTAVSNVFGYILPFRQMAAMCRERGVPFILDAAQGAGVLDISLADLGADFIAMPGHKSLLGPQGTGLLICAARPQPLLFGGTGSQSESPYMPEEGPERIEAGTQNTPGIAGLREGLRYINTTGFRRLYESEHRLMELCADGLTEQGYRVYRGAHQAATVSFCAEADCEDIGQALGKLGISVRAGLHCAPLAHESANTLESGTVRVSFGYGNTHTEVLKFLEVMAKHRGSWL